MTGIDLSRVLGWLGLDYAVYYGYGHRETLKTIQGLLVQGLIPATSMISPTGGRRFRGPASAPWFAVTGFRTDGETAAIHDSAYLFESESSR